MTEKQQTAHGYFYGGYNCAQSVFASFYEEMGLDEATALKVTAALGGGVGGLREICGAVNGAAMAIGALRGGFQPGEQEKKEQLYAAVQSMAEAFTKEFTTVNCGKLLEINEIEAKPSPAVRDEKYYEERPCGKYVEFCARLVEEELGKR
ncbi:MAG: C_GCAxxG_C_C family protein [Clostridiales bacterium]|nr:C_GCAxxG_C_C family protein [Clostridiales bacterium]